MLDERIAFLEQFGEGRETRLIENTSVGLRDVPIFRAYQDAKRLLRTSGYFERRDSAWSEVQNFALSWGEELPADPEDYRRQLIDDAVQLGYDPHIARDRADRNRYLLRLDRTSTRALRDFAYTNPDALLAAVQWGYKDELNARELSILRRLGYDLSEGYIPPSFGDNGGTSEPSATPATSRRIRNVGIGAQATPVGY